MRRLTIILILAILIASFAGCGGSGKRLPTVSPELSPQWPQSITRSNEYGTIRATVAKGPDGTSNMLMTYILTERGRDAILSGASVSYSITCIAKFSDRPDREMTPSFCWGNDFRFYPEYNSNGWIDGDLIGLVLLTWSITVERDS